MVTETTSSDQTSAAIAYMRDILRRSRVPLEPVEHKTNWDDKPRTHKVYPGAQRIRFHGGFSEDDMSLQQVLMEDMVAPRRPYTLTLLIELLWMAYGIQNRKLIIHRNEDVAYQPHYGQAIWARGASSGGSLYSMEVYLVSAGEQGIVPGVYSWDSSRNELQRLTVGNVTDRVRQALPEDTARASSFLVLTVKLWKNAFKYNTFSPYVTATDIGTACSTWVLWARSRGLDFRPHLWFDEASLNELLSVDPNLESAVAVVPLDFGGQKVEAGWHGHVMRQEAERSQSILRWERNEAVIADMRDAGNGQMPALDRSPRKRSGRKVLATVDLPECTPLEMPLGTSIMARRSSFGMLSNNGPMMTQNDLHALLEAAMRANEGVDIAGLGPHNTIGAWVLVNRVGGLRPGAYRYQAGRLEFMVDEALTEFQQRTYYLKNYDFGATAAVITLTGWPEHLMSQLGPRGMRVQSTLLGAACQYVYLASAALHLGCGAALGFANVAYAELFDTAQVESLDMEDEWPMLILAVGPEESGVAELQMILEPVQ